MASFPLDYGKFDNVGDNYTLVLSPITNVTAFSTYADETGNVVVGQREFQKEFRYKLNANPYTAFAPLTNPALAAITIVATDIILLEVRYTRIGVNTEGSL